MSRNAFIGRESELAALAAALEDARRGRGRFLTLVGEPGIGKTRTLEEFVSRAAFPDGQVVWGRCPEDVGFPAYWPWTQAIGRYVERCDEATLARELGPGASDLAPLVPSVGERIGGLEPTTPCDPAQSRLRLFESIASFLRRTAERQPIILVLDDLHWADEGSILLLTFLIPELRRSRILFLGTYREREMRRAPNLLAAVSRVSQRIPLRGLEVPEVRDFVQGANDAAPRGELVTRLHHVSQGNPFFLDELLRLLKTAGRLDGADAGADEDLAVPLPDEVRQVIRRNLEPLSADDRDLLTIAAVVGYEFDLARVRAASGLPSDRLLACIQAAAEAGAIVTIFGVAGRFRFAHMLIRDTFYGDVLPLARAELHRQVGLALEALHADGMGVAPAEL